MKKTLFSFLLSAGTLVGLTATAQATDNLKVADSSYINLRFNDQVAKGSIIKTGNNHYYEITDKINRKMSGEAKVLVYKDGRKLKMKLDGIDQLLSCNRIDDIIESNIDGDFKGYDGNASFKLQNGDRWAQDAPTGTVYANLFRPAVFIYRTPEGYKMKITGLNEDPILVRKL